MWASLTVWTTVCLCSTLAAVQRNIGDICKETTGVQWPCRPLKDCPTALQEVKKGGKLQTCGFTGSDPNVCCEPTGSKAKQMCKKYGEAVFVQLAVPDCEEGEIITIDSCAKPNSVPAGSAAHPKSYPHMAVIGYGYRGAVEWKWQGSLISEQYILSTVKYTEFMLGPEARWVRLGDYDIHSREDDQNGRAQSEDYEIVERINHPDYADSPFASIVLYKLNTSVRLSEYIRPVCLHTEEQFNESAIVASGWGFNEKIYTIQEYHMQFVYDIECKERDVSSFWMFMLCLFRAIISGLAETSENRMVFATGAYVGLKGAPLQVRLQEPYCMYSLVGVAGTHIDVSKRGLLHICRRVSYYLPWIESIVWP